MIDGTAGVKVLVHSVALKKQNIGFKISVKIINLKTNTNFFLYVILATHLSTEHPRIGLCSGETQENSALGPDVFYETDNLFCF